MSLANVADVVLFSAPLAGSTCTIFCAADLRSESVRIGDSQLRRQHATVRHLLGGIRQPSRPGQSLYRGPQRIGACNCMAQYQRSWFQLLLGESYLARIEHLQRQWDLERSVAQIAGLNELACMREYALRLLDERQCPQPWNPRPGHRGDEAAHLVARAVDRRRVARSRRDGRERVRLLQATADVRRENPA